MFNKDQFRVKAHRSFFFWAEWKHTDKKTETVQGGLKLVKVQSCCWLSLELTGLWLESNFFQTPGQPYGCLSWRCRTGSERLQQDPKLLESLLLQQLCTELKQALQSFSSLLVRPRVEPLLPPIRWASGWIVSTKKVDVRRVRVVFTFTSEHLESALVLGDRLIYDRWWCQLHDVM